MRRVAALLVVLAAGLAISAVYLVRFDATHDLSGLWAGSRIPPGAIATAVVLQVLAHVLRAKKSDLLLSVVRPVSLLTLVRGLAIGQFFNVVLPFRIGELARAHWVGREMAISRGVVFTTILFERAVDGLLLSLAALVVWASLGFPVGPSFAVQARLASGVLLASVAVAVLTWALYRESRLGLRLVGQLTAVFNDRIRDRLRFQLWSVVYGIHTMFRTAPLGRYVALSAVMWLGYLASVLALVTPVAGDASVPALVDTSMSAYLAVSMPSGPGYVGTYHYTFAELAAAALHTDEPMLELAVTSWFVLQVPFMLLGAVFLLTSRSATERTADELGPKVNKLHRDRDISTEFRHFLDEYFSGRELSRLLSAAELAGRYRLVRTFKGGSNAVTILAWQDGGLVVKKVTLEQHGPKLAEQHAWLVRYGHLPHIPEVRREIVGAGFYAFDLEYREDYVPFFEFIHSSGLDRSRAVLTGVLDFAWSELYEEAPREHRPMALDAYLRDKVEGKVRDAAAMSAVLATLVREETLTINGRPYPNLWASLETLRACERACTELATFGHTPIHGDLTVDNILVGPEGADFLLIDPNDENAISDPVVDMGKLYQSLHSGYEFLIGLERARVDGTRIVFEDAVSTRYSELFRHLVAELEARLPPEARRAILFHEAVHYCRMLTYRARINPDSLAAFYGIAVQRFHEFNQQYE